MTVIMKGGPSGNRDKNSIVSMPTQTPQPIVDSASSTPADSTNFNALNKRGTHPQDQATPDFLPKGCTVPETGPDIAEPVTKGSWGPGVVLGTPPDANR